MLARGRRSARARASLVVFALLAAAPGCGATTGSVGPGSSRYRVGDRILYRYAGEALDAPVDLEERITEVDGLRLRIEVTARRERVTRRWVQVVTDTAENRESNRVDALYEVDASGEERLLPNEGGEDLRELYEWTLPDVEWGEPGEERVTTEPRTFAGREWTCRVATTPLPSVGSDARIVLSDCDALVWTHGPGELTAGGRTLWSVVVVEIERPPL